MTSRWLAIGWLVALVAGCAVDAGGAAEGEAASGREPSAIALQIEQAERTLDRGGDARVAAAALRAALDDPAASIDERRAAALGLSRAYEAAGDREQAVAVLEHELAAHGDDRGWDATAFQTRLRKLLTGKETADGLALEPVEPVAPFAHVLARYFTPDAQGVVHTSFFIAGGPTEVAERLGTFNLRGALRAEREKQCPLCDPKVDVSQSSRHSDWLLIPEAQDKLGSAVTWFYFDLGRNRIPARYERYLPMPVAEIEAELERGKSFVVAKERVGSPPSVLLAAPRTAMLEDVERYVAELERLPVEPGYVDAKVGLRSSEIQAVVRASFRPDIKGCYDALLETSPKAGGKVVLGFRVAGDGTTRDVEVEAAEGLLEDAAFASCLGKAVTRMVFPATGGDTTVRYPVAFSP